MAIYREMYDGPPLHYGTRVTTKRVIAIHNTSNDATRQQEASYAKRRADSVSSHYYADATGVTQSLDTDLRAYHAGSTIGNDIGISYEITGVNGWSRQQWLDRVDWPALAAAVARDCRRHGIEVRLLTVAQMRDGRSTGVVTHDLMRQAWGGTTHTDPGPNFPMDHLLAMVRAAMDGDDMSERASRVVEAWAVGLTKTALGEQVEPVLWRLRDEAWQRKVDAALAADEARDKAVLAAVTALANAGGVDAAPIVAAINAVKAEVLATLATVPDAVVDELANELTN